MAASRVGWILSALIVGAFVCTVAAAQSDQPGEYEVKAAFLFNFTKFVEWPESAFVDPHAPIVIGVIGEDPFGESLVRIVAGQKAQGRSIEIVKYRYGDALRRAAHTLKGTCGNLGAPEAAATALELEKLAVAGDLSHAQESLQLLEEQIQRASKLLDELKQECVR